MAAERRELEQTRVGSGSRVNDFGLVGSGRVGSQVSVTDPVSDPVLVVFARALSGYYLTLVREYATLESIGFCVYSVFSDRLVY